MGRTVRTIVTIIFVAIVVGIGLAVLYLGSSTGLIYGGQATVTGSATAKTPFYAQVGWLKNTAPWPLTIKSITTNAAHSTDAATVWVERKQVGPVAVSTGKVPIWANDSAKLPFDLNGDSVRYLGFALNPEKGKIASFSSITVTFSGPLGLTFHKTFTGSSVAAASSELPDDVLASDPHQDNLSLNPYIALLRSALHSKSVAKMAVVMGGDATNTDAAAFLKKMSKYKSTDLTLATVVTAGDPTRQRLLFYAGDPAKNGLPPIILQWAGFRWSVVRS